MARGLWHWIFGSGSLAWGNWAAYLSLDVWVWGFGLGFLALDMWRWIVGLGHLAWDDVWLGILSLGGGWVPQVRGAVRQVLGGAIGWPIATRL